MNQKKLSSSILWVLAVIMVLGGIFLFLGITHESLWYDESYTAAAVDHSFGEIINITGGDSHPPLYYLMLRMFRLIFGNSILSLRAFSVLGAFALAAWGMGPVRRALGNPIAILYTLLVFTVPITLGMAQETRMYTWSAFWVTGSALYGYLAYREQKLKDWIFFGLCTLAAAYTHYYALLAVAMIGFLLLLGHLIEKKKILPFISVALGILAGYLPWLIKLTSQVGRVSSNFWIPPVSGTVIWKVLTYPFGDKFQSDWALALATPAFIIAAFLIIRGITTMLAKKDEAVRMPILAVGAYVLTIGAGVVASIVIRPVLVERYMMPVLGLFILGLAYGIASLGKRTPVIVAFGVILALSIPQILHVQTTRMNGPMKEIATELTSQLRPGDVFLHTDEHTFGTFIYYFPQYQHYYYQRKGYEGFSNYDAFKPNGHTISSLDEIEGEQKIWLAQRYYAPDGLSARSWMSKGELVANGGAKSYQLPDSWYGLMIYETTKGTPETMATASIIPQGSGNLTTNITGLSSDKGILLVTLYDQDPMTQNPLMSQNVPIKNGQAQVVFEDLPYGDYGIAVYHDANGNGQFDLSAEGVPMEGLGYSNTPEPPTGPPVFDNCKFRFDGQHTEIGLTVFNIQP